MPAKKQLTKCARITKYAPEFLGKLYDAKGNQWNASLLIQAYIDAVVLLDKSQKTEKSQKTAKQTVSYVHVLGMGLLFNEIRNMYMIYGFARGGCENELDEHDVERMHRDGCAYSKMYWELIGSNILENTVACYNKTMAMVEPNTISYVDDVGTISKMIHYKRIGRSKKTKDTDLMEGTCKPFSFEPLKPFQITNKAPKPQVKK